MTTTSLPAGVGTTAVPGGDLVFEVHPGSTDPVLTRHGATARGAAAAATLLREALA